MDKLDYGLIKSVLVENFLILNDEQHKLFLLNLKFEKTF